MTGSCQVSVASFEPVFLINLPGNWHYYILRPVLRWFRHTKDMVTGIDVDNLAGYAAA
jgi:hypothetical protein